MDFSNLGGHTSASRGSGPQILAPVANEVVAETASLFLVRQHHDLDGLSVKPPFEHWRVHCIASPNKHLSGVKRVPGHSGKNAQVIARTAAPVLILQLLALQIFAVFRDHEVRPIRTFEAILWRCPRHFPQ